MAVSIVSTDIADDSSADEAVEISLEIDAPADASFEAEPAMGVEDMLAMQADADAVEIGRASCRERV